eukprot:jgi/Chlat1/6306/Chrsp44S05880
MAALAEVTAVGANTDNSTAICQHVAAFRAALFAFAQHRQSAAVCGGKGSGGGESEHHAMKVNILSGSVDLGSAGRRLRHLPHALQWLLPRLQDARLGHVLSRLPHALHPQVGQQPDSAAVVPYVPPQPAIQVRASSDDNNNSRRLARQQPSLRRVTCYSHPDFSTSVQRNDAASTGPGVSPQVDYSPMEAVMLQLQALMSNDEPRVDHGLEVLYNFAVAAESSFGGNGMSRYFGFTTDLYHFGHFALKFRTRYKRLLQLRLFEIVECSAVRIDEDGPRRQQGRLLAG